VRAGAGPLLATLLSLTLAGCGSAPKEGPVPDLRMDQPNDAGNRALQTNQPTVAVRQFRLALSRAYERDDAGAIGDIGYNLAVAQLRAGATEDAARTVRETRSELDLRRITPPADLILVQAAIDYRLGALDKALASTQEVLDRSPLNPEAAERAWYIRGAVLADQGDAQGLAQAIAALGAATQPDQQADRLELTGRAAVLRGTQEAAVTDFEQAADQRRLALDYRGMARCLALAGDASLRIGRTAAAAGLFLRAGRSAFLQGDTRTGLALLNRADQLARQTGLADIVADVERLKRSVAAGATPS
jgi:tetratricopeptide (TPR) repeat protein